jgi:hypothetical protein
MDERRHGRSSPSPPDPSHFLQRFAHLTFGNRLGADHSWGGSRSAQRSFKLARARIRQLQDVAVLDRAGDTPAALASARPQPRTIIIAKVMIAIT